MNDVDKNKIIVENCPNFYKIINYDYMPEDAFTDRLIKIYRSYIFSVNPLNVYELNRVKELDRVLSKYIDDNIFQRSLKNELVKVKFQSKENLLQNLINSILNIFEKYEEGQTRNIYISRWI